MDRTVQSHFLLKAAFFVYLGKNIEKRRRYQMGDKNPNKLKKKKKTAEKATVQPIMTTETSAAKKPKK
jgi:hypothetical protein